ncbi:RNA polymerase subunit sigma-24 [Brachybacterium kimchii]|uniref:RNA polymerase subunit sigma-24 n=2 Tax=Brachybacterium kimchii TaxID=2942909 RepID=A0ABY4N869_9MICO|nr:RNA polymerase subunit sigma-24 [Brachybacterium kimchii]
MRRRGADFADAEDAVQEALVQALERWPREPPGDPAAWLVTVAWRRHVDAVRSASSRRRREEADHALSTRQAEDRAHTDPGVTTSGAQGLDDTLELFFLCAHRALSPSAAAALTLRAVGGLTTRQIAAAHMVPEATMAQRISRAKRTIAGRRLDEPGDVSTVAQVLYLIFNEGYRGEIDLASEAIRLARQLHRAVDHPEASGLLSLMLLHHARRPARFAADGGLVPLSDQDRSLWDSRGIAEGVGILQRALAHDSIGPFQAQAAIAALHADARTVEETDWVQIVGWYDDLLALTESPVVALNRAIAVGEADGALAGLAALAEVAEDVPRRTAAAAYLHEKAGRTELAAELYARAARNAGSLPEREHLLRQAARLGGGGDARATSHRRTTTRPDGVV